MEGHSKDGRVVTGIHIIIAVSTVPAINTTTTATGHRMLAPRHYPPLTVPDREI